MGINEQANPGSGRGAAGNGDGYLYWADCNANAIGRATVDGGGVNLSFISGDNFPLGVAVDATHVYWAAITGTIGRAGLDGSGLDQNFIPAGIPFGVGGRRRPHLLD